MNKRRMLTKKDRIPNAKSSIFPQGNEDIQNINDPKISVMA